MEYSKQTPVILAHRWVWRQWLYELWQKYLNYDPANPVWPNRDRFCAVRGARFDAAVFGRCILPACGLTRQKEKCRRSQPSRWMRSSASGNWTARRRAIRNRTLPAEWKQRLDRWVKGAGNSVGMAIASKWLAANYNQPGFEIFDFKTYAVCGDGDLMEGVASEAASLAGHLRLGNLCWIYDNNHVTLDGPASWSFSEDVMTRFVGYGWNVTRVADANDLMTLARAYETFPQDHRQADFACGGQPHWIRITAQARFL